MAAIRGGNVAACPRRQLRCLGEVPPELNAHRTLRSSELIGSGAIEHHVHANESQDQDHRAQV
jgi:hypothetical protein